MNPARAHLAWGREVREAAASLIAATTIRDCSATFVESPRLPLHRAHWY